MAYRFNPPPNWPIEEAGWTPPPGWTPDPEWGPAPDGWNFWAEAEDSAAAGSAPALGTAADASAEERPETQDESQAEVQDEAQDEAHVEPLVEAAPVSSLGDEPGIADDESSVVDEAPVVIVEDVEDVEGFDAELPVDENSVDEAPSDLLGDSVSHESEAPFAEVAADESPAAELQVAEESEALELADQAADAGEAVHPVTEGAATTVGTADVEVEPEPAFEPALAEPEPTPAAAEPVFEPALAEPEPVLEPAAVESEPAGEAAPAYPEPAFQPAPVEPASAPAAPAHEASDDVDPELRSDPHLAPVPAPVHHQAPGEPVSAVRRFWWLGCLLLLVIVVLAVVVGGSALAAEHSASALGGATVLGQAETA